MAGAPRLVLQPIDPSLFAWLVMTDALQRPAYNPSAPDRASDKGWDSVFSQKMRGRRRRKLSRLVPPGAKGGKAGGSWPEMYGLTRDPEA